MPFTGILGGFVESLQKYFFFFRFFESKKKQGNNGNFAKKVEKKIRWISYRSPLIADISIEILEILFPAHAITRAPKTE